MTSYEEEQLGRLLRSLPAPPQGWVAAAQELPAARLVLDRLVERAVEDAELRRAVLEDLEGALRAAGIEPTRRHLAVVRSRLVPCWQG